MVVAWLAVALLVPPDGGAEVGPGAGDPAARPRRGATFAVDPVADGAIFSLSVGFGLLSSLVIQTGEIQPQQPVDPDRLLPIDRPALDYGRAPSAGPLSDAGIALVGVLAGVDAAWTGMERGVEAGTVDAVIYAETAAVTWAATNLSKIAVRRPRPRAYQRAAENAGDPDFRIAETDSALSFYSGHTASAAALSSAAAYLAFTREAGGARRWLVLGLGATLTGFVGWQRIRSGDHFPTDVIAGAMAGAGIGVLVPHLHRTDDVRERGLWIGGTGSAEAPGLVIGGRL